MFTYEIKSYETAESLFYVKVKTPLVINSGLTYNKHFYRVIEVVNEIDEQGEEVLATIAYVKKYNV